MPAFARLAIASHGPARTITDMMDVQYKSHAAEAGFLSTCCPPLFRHIGCCMRQLGVPMPMSPFSVPNTAEAGLDHSLPRWQGHQRALEAPSGLHNPYIRTRLPPPYRGADRSQEASPIVTLTWSRTICQPGTRVVTKHTSVSMRRRAPRTLTFTRRSGPRAHRPVV